jgi:hypothetical protein
LTDHPNSSVASPRRADTREKISILKPIRAENGQRREEAFHRDARQSPGCATTP